MYLPMNNRYQPFLYNPALPSDRDPLQNNRVSSTTSPVKTHHHPQQPTSRDKPSLPSPATSEDHTSGADTAGGGGGVSAFKSVASSRISDKLHNHQPSVHIVSGGDTAPVSPGASRLSSRLAGADPALHRERDIAEGGSASTMSGGTATLPSAAGPALPPALPHVLPARLPVLPRLCSPYFPPATSVAAAAVAAAVDERAALLTMKENQNQGNLPQPSAPPQAPPPPGHLPQHHSAAHQQHHPAFPVAMPVWAPQPYTLPPLHHMLSSAAAANNLDHKSFLAAASGASYLTPDHLAMAAAAAAKNPFFDLARMAGHYPLGKKLFGCPQCRYITDRKNNLKRHIATMHQECEKVLECCGVVFKNKASLRDHVLIFHSNGYMCRFCGRNFCRKALLKRHLTVHSGQKDYICELCDYATSHKSNLERHKKVHERQGTDDEREDDDDDEDIDCDDMDDDCLDSSDSPSSSPLLALHRSSRDIRPDGSGGGGGHLMGGSTSSYRGLGVGHASHIPGLLLPAGLPPSQCRNTRPLTLHAPYRDIIESSTTNKSETTELHGISDLDTKDEDDQNTLIDVV